ncbi:MAG: hypothetical protein ACKOWF_06545 [Chloroflexota bacterium]
MEPFILGAPLVALVPGLVEAMKRAGMATRWAGLAAVGWATLLVALADVAGANLTGVPGGGGPVSAGRIAGWLLAGVVYGLAAAGLYSQARAVRQV